MVAAIRPQTLKAFMNPMKFPAPRRVPVTGHLHRWHGAAWVAGLGLVAACGGVSEPDNAPAGPALPTSGTYSWVLKPQGTTASPRYGLSFVHPLDAVVERVIEPPSAALTDVKPLPAGIYDVPGSRVTSVRPQWLLYVSGGDVRSVPLVADGSAPRDRVQRALSTSACRFLVDAIDHGQPLNSRWTVSTAGSDGSCDTADDGWAEITLSPQAQPRVTPGTGDAPLAMTRDPATLAPRGWIMPRSVLFWGTGAAGGSPTTVATRNSIEPSFSAVLLATPRAALADDGTRLVMLDFGTGSSLTVRPLDTVATAGGGWRGIGFDADAYFVFRNSSATSASTWRVLRIARSDGSATSLATGDGQLSNASMGTGRLYASVLGAQNNRLISIAKTGPTTPTTLDTTPVSTFSTVVASAGTVHQLFRVTNLGSAGAGYAIEFIDETGARLYASDVGGYPVAIADAATLNLNTSESRTRFLFVTGYGQRGYADSTLLSYDSAARSVLSLGKLPGTTDFGQNVVFASVTVGPGSFGGGFAGRAVGTTVDSAGSKVFSFDTGSAGSLKLASPPS